MKTKLGLFTATALGLLGCAQASIRKVPNRSDYDTWTDGMQARVDGMCGLRVYGSRPYVVVHQAFPLPPSESFLVDGVVSADGKFIRLDPKASRGGSKDCALLSEGLKHFSGGGDTYVVPSTALWKSQGTPAATTAGNPKAEGTVVTAPALPASPAHAKAEDRPSGDTSLSLQTELDAWATRKLGERFEIVYLPDFEEQYVIDPQANLGSARVAMTQGPGGQLLAMGMQVDNSAITRPLVDAYTKAVEAVGTRLTTALGTDPADSLVTPKAEGVEVGEVKTATGHPITVRVHVLTMASPGIYPVLKASEVVDSRSCMRELARCFKCKGERTPCEDCRTRWAPCGGPGCSEICMLECGFPGSRIAYQTYRVILVEHLITSPGQARIVGLAEGTEVQTRKAEGVEVPDLDALNLLLRRKIIDIPCVTFVAATAMEPKTGGNKVDIRSVTIQLDHTGHVGAPPQATSNACHAIVDDIVRRELPGLEAGEAGLRVEWVDQP
jgi:hypothetical protein